MTGWSGGPGSRQNGKGKPEPAAASDLRHFFGSARLRRAGSFSPWRPRAWLKAPTQESAMTSDGKPRRIEVKDGDQTVAAAEVTTADQAGGTVRTSLLPSSGHSPPGRRASLVDAVMDLPEVQASSRLEATLPLGDAESLERLRERTEDTVSRPAGSTTLVDADIPPAEFG